jgi:hypothetical protein
MQVTSLFSHWGPICGQINGKMVALTLRAIDDGEVRSILKWAAGRDTALTDILEGKSSQWALRAF